MFITIAKPIFQDSDDDSAIHCAAAYDWNDVVLHLITKHKVDPRITAKVHLKEKFNLLMLKNLLFG